MADEVQFASMADGSEVAYRVISHGDGPVTIHTTVGPFPLDLLSEEPMYDRFLQTLGGYGLVVYARPGLGSSESFDRERDWIDQMSGACVAVLDAVGADGDIDFGGNFADLHVRGIDLPTCLEVLLTMTRNLNGAAKIAATPPPLAATNATLRRSLDVTTRLTAPFGTGGR